MVSVIELTLCVHVEQKSKQQKSKQQNISSCVVIFTVLKDYSFLKALMKTNLNEDQVNTLLYGSQTNNSKRVNQEILKFVIACMKATTRFGRSLISNQ